MQYSIPSTQLATSLLQMSRTISRLYLCIVVLLACTHSHDSLVGKWSADFRHADHDLTHTIHLRQDQSLTKTLDSDGPSGKNTMSSHGTWSVTGDSLSLVSIDDDGRKHVSTSAYAIKGDTLIFFNSINGHDRVLKWIRAY